MKRIVTSTRRVAIALASFGLLTSQTVAFTQQDDTQAVEEQSAQVEAVLTLPEKLVGNIVDGDGQPVPEAHVVIVLHKKRTTQQIRRNQKRVELKRWEFEADENGNFSFSTTGVRQRGLKEPYIIVVGARDEAGVFHLAHTDNEIPAKQNGSQLMIFDQVLDDTSGIDWVLKKP